MSWKRLRAISVVVGLTLVLAACGGDGDGDGAVGQSPGELPRLDGQSVTVMGIWASSEQENFEKVLQLFEQQTGADVTYTSAGDDLPTVLGTRIEGGSPPDIALPAQPGFVEGLVRRGVLKPVDDVASEVVDQHYQPVWRQLGTFGGKLYGVWFKADNKSTMWYNKHVFEDAGVQPPKTWDELKQAAQTILDSGVTPFSIGGADGWTLTDWFENVYVRTAGPEKYDQLAAHEIEWTDSSVRQALRTLAEIFGNSRWINGGTAGALQTNFDNSVPPVYTSPPRAAMVYEGSFVADIIQANTEAQLGTDADFFDFPSIGGSPATVVGTGNIAVVLTENEAAKQLVRFLGTPEAAEVWIELGGFISPNKSADLAKYPSEITRTLAEAVSRAETFRFDLSDLQPAAFGATQGQGMWGILQDFLRRPRDIDGIARQLEAAAARAFK